MISAEEACLRAFLTAWWILAIVVCLVAEDKQGGSWCDWCRRGCQRACDRIVAASHYRRAFDNMGTTFAVMMAMAAVLLPFGLKSGFLRPNCWPGDPLATCWPPAGQAFNTAILSAFIGLFEELLFRVLPLPVPNGRGTHDWAKMSVMLITFAVSYHMCWFHCVSGHDKTVFDDWRFLVMACVMGAGSTCVYVRSGSWWLAAVVHGLLVWLWINFFGGAHRFWEAEHEWHEQHLILT